MKKALASLLAILLGTSGCSSVQVKGRSLYPEDKAMRSLVQDLENGKGKLTKELLAAKIPGQPQIHISKDGEIWHYAVSQKESTLRFTISGVMRTNRENSDELTLNFDGQGLLKDYDLKSKRGEEIKDKSEYGYELSPAFFGAILGIVTALLLGITRK